jgi:hypothetical protein
MYLFTLYSQIQVEILIIFACLATTYLLKGLLLHLHTATPRQGVSSIRPKSLMGAVSNSLGGVMPALSPCDFPRNERQVVYLTQASKCRDRKHIKSGPHSDPFADQVFSVMQAAKLGDRDGLFVHETRPSPEPAFVLARDRQLDELERFCTDPNMFSILTVDPTFNLGDFDVTPITYRHKLY